MQTDRRTVMMGAASLLAGAPAAAAGTAPDLLSRMSWLNPPPSFTLRGGALEVQSSPKADFYRLPGWTIDTGNFFNLAVPGDFVFEARVNGRFATRYDQAGLMVRRDAETWMKCGIELDQGARQASVVFTRTFSDWSTMKALSDAAPVWWRVVRRANSVDALCSLDGETFTFVRSGYFPPSPEVQVGLLCASTDGQGVAATFDSVKLSPA